ncbi:MAG TPA: metallophosphoesterase [Geminicoccaceae bacterium]
MDDGFGRQLPADEDVVALDRCLKGSDRPRVCSAVAHERRLWREERRRMEASRDWFTPGGRKRRRAVEPLTMILSSLRRALEASAPTRRVFDRSLDVARRSVELRLPGLPRGLDGYTILHVSDPHVDALPGLGDAIVRACAGVEVDLLALTGDFRAACFGPFEEHHIFAPLAALLAGVSARDGAFAVLGNHDSEAMLEPLEALGLQVLVNREHIVRRGADRLSLVGLDDPHRFYGTSTARCLDSLSDGGDVFRLFLVHSPELASRAAAEGGDLYLCGHTHGGQICLPGGYPVLRRLHAERDLAAGPWRRGAMVGYTSAGAGVANSLPLRLFSRSEVALLTLRHEGPRAA